MRFYLCWLDRVRSTSVMNGKTPVGPAEDEEAASSATHRQDYPEVNAWLHHASAAHPWVQLLDACSRLWPAR